QVALLAEIDGDGRPAVPDRAGTGELLAAVQVAERGVLGGGREGGRLEVVREDRLGLALAAAEPAAGQRAVRGDDVDRVIAEPGGERADQLGDAGGVVAVVL